MHISNTFLRHGFFRLRLTCPRAPHLPCSSLLPLAKHLLKDTEHHCVHLHWRCGCPPNHGSYYNDIQWDSPYTSNKTPRRMVNCSMRKGTLQSCATVYRGRLQSAPFKPRSYFRRSFCSLVQCMIPCTLMHLDAPWCTLMHLDAPWQFHISKWLQQLFLAPDVLLRTGTPVTRMAAWLSDPSDWV